MNELALFAHRRVDMRELALFAGAGGGILGGHLLGWRTVCAVEIEDYPRRVLLQRQADGILPRFPIWDDVCTFDGKPWRGKIDVISGGFPCQDISAAGKGAGLSGERSGLWSEFARIIGEVRPKYAFVENSPVLTSRGLGTVLGDLAEMGYDAEWGVLGAHHAGAPHKRDRIWVLAYTNGSRSNEDPGNSELWASRSEQSPQDKGPSYQREAGQVAWWDNDPAEVPNAYDPGLQRRRAERELGEDSSKEQTSRCSGRATEPGMGRVAYELADKLDELRTDGQE